VDEWWIHLSNEAAVCRMQIDEDEHTALEEIERLEAAGDAETEITAARSFEVGEEVVAHGLDPNQDAAPENSQQDDLKVPIGTALPLDSRNIDVTASTANMAAPPTNPAEADDFVDTYSVVKPGAYPAEPADDIDAYSALEAHSADGYSNVEVESAPSDVSAAAEETYAAEPADPVLADHEDNGTGFGLFDDNDTGFGLFDGNDFGLF